MSSRMIAISVGGCLCLRYCFVVCVCVCDHRTRFASLDAGHVGQQSRDVFNGQ